MYVAGAWECSSEGKYRQGPTKRSATGKRVVLSPFHAASLFCPSITLSPTAYVSTAGPCSIVCVAYDS